jgi:acetyl-CoA synthetase
MRALLTSGIDWSAPSYDEVVRRHRWIIPERLNIAVAACDVHAADDRLALVTEADEDGGDVREWSFSQLKALSDGAARLLQDAGVERGDRVAVFLPQRLENAVAHLSILKLGAISVPLSPLFRRDALEHRIEHSEAKVVITDADHKPHLAAALAQISTRPIVIEADDLPSRADPLAQPISAVDTSKDDPAMLIYTSGTSGLPKGALHAHRFLAGRLSGFELLHQLERSPSRDRPFWTPADWAWVGGLVDCVLTPWVFGCPVLAYRKRQFEPRAIFSMLERRRVRSAFLPPTALNLLRRGDDGPGRSALELFSVHSAGEPLSPETYAWASGRLGAIRELYGMTEMGATIGGSPFFDVAPGWIGKPYPGHRVSLLDEAGAPVKQGEVGEIAVERPDPGLFLGYFKDPRATDARFFGDHFRTGDLARVDGEGRFCYMGRTDDVFNSAGYRIGPAEIERCLETHPEVERAAVVGEPDSDRGEVVKAFVLLRSSATASLPLAREIQRHVKERLATYEYPRCIVFARELPLTVTGKIRRIELRSQAADERYGLLRFAT